MRKITLFMTALFLLSFCVSAAAQQSDVEKVVRVVECSEGDNLADLLGDEWNRIDSLVVTGYVDSTDFKVIRDGVLFGKISGLDLSGCRLEDDKFPERAFLLYNPVSHWLTHAAIQLRYVRLPEGLKEIGSGAFFASGVREVNIPSTVREIGSEAFCLCNELSGKIKIPEGVTTIHRLTFGSCHYVTSIELPSTLTYLGNNAFYNLFRVTSIEIPNSVEYLGSAFAMCHGIEEIRLPDHLQYIDGDAFMNTQHLRKLTNWPAHIHEVPHHCFYGCAFDEWFLPDHVTDLGPFSMVLNRYVDLTIPDNIRTIGHWAFMGNWHMERLVLPQGLQELGEGAFNGCSNLREVYMRSPVPPMQTHMETDFYEELYETRDVFAGIAPDAVLYVPSGSLMSYLQAGYHKHFSDVREYDISAGIAPLYASQQESQVYDLQGRRVEKPTQRGIYLKGGRKYVVR